MKRLLILLSLIFLPFTANALMDDEGIWKEIEAHKDSFKEAPAIMLFDTIDTVFKDNGAAVTEEAVCVLIRKENAGSKYRALTYEFNPRTAHIRFKDVKIFRAESHEVEKMPLDTVFTEKAPADSIFWNFDTVVCPVPYLKEGDALFYVIERRGLNLAYLGNDYSDDEPWNRDYIPPQPGHFMDTVFFDDEIPIISKHYSIKGPKTKPLQFAMANGTMDVSFRFDDDYFYYDFSVENRDAFQKELFAVEFSQAALKLALASHPSWEMKSRWAYEHNETQFIISPEMQTKVDEIIANAKDDDDKMFRLLHWVAEEIRYLGLDMGEGEGHKVHPTDEIFEDRAGVCKDKAAILVSMLRAAGFESYFVMTLAMEQTLDLPADDQFNHGVVAVRKSDNQWVFLDPTWAPQNRPLFNTLEQEQPILIASPEGTDLMNIPYSPPEENPFIIDAESVLDSQGNLVCQMHIKTDGNPDGHFRNYLSVIRKDLIPNLFLDLLDDISDQAELLSFNYTNPMDFYQPMELDLRFQYPHAGTLIDDLLIVQPILAQHPMNDRYESDYLYLPTDSKDRKHDIEFRCTRLVEFHETLRIPSGYELETLPETVHMSSEGIDLDFEIIREKPDVLVLNETIKIKHRIVEVSAYSEMAKVVDKINELREMELVLKRNKNRLKNPPLPHKPSNRTNGGKMLPDFGAVINLHQYDVTLTDDGDTSELFTYEVHVYNEEGIDEYADNRFIINEDYQTYNVIKNRTTTPEGDIIDAPETAVNLTLDYDVHTSPDYRNIKTLTVSHTGVEKGSLLSSCVERITSQKASNHFEFVYPLVDFYPAESKIVTVTVPSQHPLTFELMGEECEPVVEKTTMHNRYTWKFQNITPMMPEPLSGPYYEMNPVLLVSGYSDSDWKTRLSDFQQEFFVTEQSQNILSDHINKILKDAQDPESKISALKAYIDDVVVTTNVSPRRVFFKTRDIERIMETGYGNELEKLKLMAAFIEKAGGTFSLCFAGRSDRISERVPCLQAFRNIYGIASIDGINSIITFSRWSLDQKDIPAQRILVLHRDSYEWINPADQQLSGNICRMDLDLVFLPDDKVDGKLMISCTGYLNPYRQLRSNTNEWLKKTIAQIVDNPEIISSNILEISDLPDGKTWFQCNFNGTVTMESVNDSYRTFQVPTCPFGLSNIIETLQIRSQRYHDIYLPFVAEEVLDITLTYPDAWQLSKNLTSESFDYDGFSMVLTTDNRDNRVTINKSFKITSPVVSKTLFKTWVKTWNAFYSDNANLLVWKTAHDEAEDK
ncbi:DUF3857 domain-containing protein [bacterium]|nr:DUF3857 domain-containing protein [candidate division CSSED10-310 bacterium]